MFSSFWVLWLFFLIDSYYLLPHLSQPTLGVLISLLTLRIHIVHDLSSVQVLVCTLLMNGTITIYILKIPTVSLSPNRLPPLVKNLCHLTIDELSTQMPHWQLNSYSRLNPTSLFPHIRPPLQTQHLPSYFLKLKAPSLITQIRSIALILSTIYFLHSN